MGKSTERKLFHYIKVGKLRRVQSLFKKHKPSYLTAIVDRKGRTPLHVCCLLGDDAIMRFLLKNGANVEVTDSDGNSPIDFALKYIEETWRFSALNDLILPLVNVCSRNFLDVKNNEGKTARQCLIRLKRAFRYDQREKEMESQRRQHWRMNNEKISKKEEDLEWERKLHFEAGQEDFSKYNQDDYVETTQETYDEWVERIMHERWQKRTASKQEKTEADSKRRQHQEQARERTKQLEKEHEAYMKRMSIERQKLKLGTNLAEYEKQCQVTFDSDSRTTIKFADVPWPCQGDTNEMISLVKKWSELKPEEERKKFLKEQQVRWHPDKFLQKCGSRLDSDEREKVMEQVKQLSQEINSLLD